MRISVYSTTEKFPEDPSRETAECENQLKYDLAMEGSEFRCLNYLTKQSALHTQNGKIEK